MAVNSKDIETLRTVRLKIRGLRRHSPPFKGRGWGWGLRLGIELDGASHDYKYEYDEQRTEYLRQQGIRVLRFSNQQVFTSMQGVLAEIMRAANEVTDPNPSP